METPTIASSHRDVSTLSPSKKPNMDNVELRQNDQPPEDAQATVRSWFEKRWNISSGAVLTNMNF